VSDEMFDFEEKSSGCPKCGHVMQDGVCLWCNAPKIQDTRPKVMSRRSDPSTSKRAAQKAKYRTGTHKDLLLRAYGRNPARRPVMKRACRTTQRHGSGAPISGTTG
jgi:hypothetical protein